MIKLMLKEMNQDHVTYLYQAEGKGEYGEIIYIFTDKHASVAKPLQDDDCGYYANKAKRAVEECIDEKNLPMKFTRAWY